MSVARAKEGSLPKHLSLIAVWILGPSSTERGRVNLIHNTTYIVAFGALLILDFIVSTEACALPDDLSQTAPISCLVSQS